jgi:hypothetical protein
MAHEQCNPTTGSASFRDVTEDYVLFPTSDPESSIGFNKSTDSQRTPTTAPIEESYTVHEAADKQPEALNAELGRPPPGLTNRLHLDDSLKQGSQHQNEVTQQVSGIPHVYRASSLLIPIFKIDDNAKPNGPKLRAMFFAVLFLWLVIFRPEATWMSAQLALSRGLLSASFQSVAVLIVKMMMLLVMLRLMLGIIAFTFIVTVPSVASKALIHRSGISTLLSWA